jgi:hypothetical protein
VTDSQIASWRSYVTHHPTISAQDADEMESHLRDQMDSLVAVGLDEDEAFLISVRRLGRLDEVSREFAQEHTERLWKQLVDPGPAEPRRRRDLGVVVVLAVLAAVAARLGIALLSPHWAARDAALLVLPFPTAYFIWSRRPPGGVVAGIVTAYVVTAVFLNAYPFGSQTGPLQAGHALALLWLVGVGVAYAGGQWRSSQRRMDLIRFTGEWAVYYALLALGGGVLLALCHAAFSAAGVSIDTFLSGWVLPGGAAGAVVVAAWLVEAKQSVIENMAPVLTRVFTPLTFLMLLAVLGAFAAGPGALDVGRELLIVMDLILALVLGLLLYALSARDRGAGPSWFDRLQLALVAAALLVDLVGGYAMVARIASFGWTANKATALGLNVVLLGNLVPSAWLLLEFVRGRRDAGALERWQTSYVPVYAAWALIVVIAVPPVFGFR